VCVLTKLQDVVLLVIISIPLSFFIYVIFSWAIAGPMAGMYSYGQEQIGVITAFALLVIFSFISGFLGGYISRERIGPLFGGIITAIYILSYNDGTLISKAIFYAPYATLGSDDVLLGISSILFFFLWGGKLGEQYGFRKDRSRLLPEGV